MKLLILTLLCASPVFAHPHVVETTHQHENIEEVVQEVQTAQSENNLTH